MGQVKNLLIDLMAELGAGDEAAARDFVLFGGCPECLETRLGYDWQGTEDGERRIAIQCGACGADLGFAPLEPLYIHMADARASKGNVVP